MHLIKIFLNCVVAAIGVMVLHHSHLVTGGTGGLSLSISYLFGFQFFIVFFLMNIPFYIFSLKVMGLRFTLNTLFSVTSLSFVTMFDRLMPSFIIPPLIGALLGGCLIGLGVSGVFLNKSSLGGFNILAVYTQKQFGWSPGTINFIFDFIAVASGFYAVGPWKGFLSVVSILVQAAIINYFKSRIAIKNSFSANSKVSEAN